LQQRQDECLRERHDLVYHATNFTLKV
jgi:hypothetical protein